MPRPETCVGAVVVHDGHLLLIRRGRGPARGQWSVPGGRVEWGETLAKAVVREVAEETGLVVECGPYLGYVERMSDRYHYVIHDFLAIPAPATPRSAAGLIAGDDAADAAWVPMAAVASLHLVAGLLEFLQKHGVVQAAS